MRLRNSMRRSLAAISRATPRCSPPLLHRRRPARIAADGPVGEMRCAHPQGIDRRASRRGRRAARPPATSTTRVARPPARSSSWLATITVAPASTAARSVASSSSRPAASRPAWGSSSSHSSARRATRQARAVRRRCPADSLATLTPARRPSRSRRCIDAAISSSVAPTVAPQKRTFSRTVRSVYRPLVWPSRPTRARTARAIRGQVVAEHPCPLPRSSGRRPAHRRSSVVLPAPFGPRSRTISPRSTCRVAPASAGNRPRTATASTSSTTAAMPVGPRYWLRHRPPARPVTPIGAVAVPVSRTRRTRRPRRRPTTRCVPGGPRSPSWTLLANRVGYLLVALAVATFLIGFAIGFSSAVATIVDRRPRRRLRPAGPVDRARLRGEGRRAGGPRARAVIV